MPQAQDMKEHNDHPRLQGDGEGRMWLAFRHRTCRTQRLHIAKVLRRNPSLRRTVPDELVDAYEIARVEAAGDLAVAEETMPTRCPWRVEQILDADFWPEVEAAR